MAVNTQFSIAVHIMAGLAHRCEHPITSAQLARSINTSPSFVRRILARLSKAGLVETTTGKTGACRLARGAKTISLRDIYTAVEAPKVFAIHTYSEHQACIVSCNIKATLEKTLKKTQTAMETSLAEITLAQIISDVKRK